jgi:hypothetical protein
MMNGRFLCGYWPKRLQQSSWNGNGGVTVCHKKLNRWGGSRIGVGMSGMLRLLGSERVEGVWELGCGRGNMKWE